MKAPKQENTFKQVPSGPHPAILYSLIDLGTQEVEFQGKTKHQRKVRMSFELHSDEAKMDDGRPMVVGRTFTLSSYETAQLRQFIEGWRGMAFSDDEADAFDYQTMLGKPCILNISLNKANNGKTYANIDSATRLMKGMTPPEQVNETVYFYMGDDDTGYTVNQAQYDAFPDWMQDIIAKSPEYRRAFNMPDPEPAKGKAAPENNGAPFNDEIPF